MSKISITILAAISCMVLSCEKDEYKDAPNTELKSHKLFVSIDDVNFNIPLTYYYNIYESNGGHWPIASEEEKTSPKKRKVADSLRFVALTPDMEPYNDKNSDEFKKPGWGRKVQIYLTHRERPDWFYYFKYTAPRLVSLPKNEYLPQMLHYFDSATGHDVYLSSDSPRRDLVQIICDTADSVSRHFPSCSVTASYMDRFKLHYSFALSMLDKWPEIDNEVRGLLDQFHQEALAGR